MFKSLFSSGSATSSGTPAKELESLLEKMIVALVDEPKEVQLQQIDSNEDIVSFELRVAKNDLGKVIGKKGRTASAMRTILSAASRKHRIGSDLRIVE
jgi:predicted RNA-binding protein YlqC (UPF0109 family)